MHLTSSSFNERTSTYFLSLFVLKIHTLSLCKKKHFTGCLFQGVDLGNIITDPVMRKDAEKELTECLQRLSNSNSNDLDNSSIMSDVATIKRWADKGIQFR